MVSPQHARINLLELWNLCSRLAVFHKRTVRSGSEADKRAAIRRVRFTPNSDRESAHLLRGMSALPPKADMCGALVRGGFGPKADIKFSFRNPALVARNTRCGID